MMISVTMEDCQAIFVSWSDLMLSMEQWLLMSWGIMESGFVVVIPR